jgi:hypothetical protein
MWAGAAFAVVAWVAGAFVLPLFMSSGADRWVVAAGLGVAVAALAALWGQSWASTESDTVAALRKGPATSASGGRSITVSGDIGGIASTGDNATNIQHR